MADIMQFPETWEEFERDYGFTDTEEVYTNGARLIPSFRVEQWLEHKTDRLKLVQESVYTIMNTAQTDYAQGARDIMDDIRNAPTVNAVPVVRCKDCKHSEHWYSDKRLCHLWNETGIDVFEYGYCSYGERKTDDNY